MPYSLLLYVSPDTHQTKAEEKLLLKCLQLFTNVKIFFLPDTIRCFWGVQKAIY